MQNAGMPGTSEASLRRKYATSSCDQNRAGSALRRIQIQDQWASARSIEHQAGLRRFAGERALGRLVEVLQQLALPGIPDLGAGAANVGHRQQVQGGEPLLSADDLGEARDDLGIGQFLLLRDRGHRQVVLDQEDDQRGVFMRAGRRPGKNASTLPSTEWCAAALGDVVEQRCDVQPPGTLETGHQLTAERVLVGVLVHRESAQVAHDHQDVLVDRVDMEQVVLHATDDAPKRRQVAAEHRPLVHSPQHARDAPGLLEQFQEQCAVGRLAPEARIDPGSGMPDRAQRRGGHAGDLGMLLQHQECPQDGGRIAFEQGWIDHVEQSAPVLEFVVDRLGLGAGLRKQRDLEVLQQDRVHLGDRLGGPEVTLHQFFRSAARIVTQTQGGGDLGLQSKTSQSSRRPATMCRVARIACSDRSLRTRVRASSSVARPRRARSRQ
jgi:hypothetical protein